MSCSSFFAVAGQSRCVEVYDASNGSLAAFSSDCSSGLSILSLISSSSQQPYILHGGLGSSNSTHSCITSFVPAAGTLPLDEQFVPAVPRFNAQSRWRSTVALPRDIWCMTPVFHSSPNEPTDIFVSATDDGCLRSWNLTDSSSGSVLVDRRLDDDSQTRPPRTGCCVCSVTSSTGKRPSWVAANADWNGLGFWCVEKDTFIREFARGRHTLRGDTDFHDIEGMAYSGASDALYCVTNAGAVKKLDLTSWSVAATYSRRQSVFRSVAVFPWDSDSGAARGIPHYLCIGDEFGKLELFDDRKIGHGGPVTAIQVHQKNAGKSGSSSVWGVVPVDLSTVDGGISSSSSSSIRLGCASCSEDGSIVVCRVDSAHLKRLREIRRPRECRNSPVYAICSVRCGKAGKSLFAFDSDIGDRVRFMLRIGREEGAEEEGFCVRKTMCRTVILTTWRWCFVE